MLKAAACALSLCTLAGPALAVPVDISYTAMIMSNTGDETDGVFVPGTGYSVSVRVDSDTLLTGALRPASGMATTIGGPGLSLPVHSARQSGVVGGPNNQQFWKLSFSGDGPFFPADGDPPTGREWQWAAAHLYFPWLADLDAVLALSLDDMNALLPIVDDHGRGLLATFTHHPNPNTTEFEYAWTTALYSFSIARAAVPAPPLPVWLVLAAAALLTPSRRARAQAAGPPKRSA